MAGESSQLAAVNRAYVRMNALEVAKYDEMRRSGGQSRSQEKRYPMTELSQTLLDDVRNANGGSIFFAHPGSIPVSSKV